jgi:flagellar basal-body rod protein FlgB
MDAKSSIFDLCAQRMGWLKQRHEVLAQNVANADTPGYRPHDLSEKSFAKALQGSLPVGTTQRTNAGHMPGTLENGRGPRSYPSETSYESAPSGNAVVLEEQLVKTAEVQMNHSTVTNLYGKYMRMFRMAVGGGAN